MPWDIFALEAPVQLTPPMGRYSAIEPDPSQISKAADLLKSARNPMIMVGGGAVNAPEEVLALAEMLQAPVVSYRSGRGVVSEEHYLGFTCAAGFRRWAEADVIVGIGSRLQLLWSSWPKRNPRPVLINIDIDPTQAVRLKPTVSIVGDAKQAVEELVAAVQRVASPRPSRRQEFETVKQATWREIQKVRPQIDFLRVIRQVLPRDGFFVEDISQVGFTSYYGFPVYSPRTFVTCGYQANLGFGFPTALGVKVANPSKAVVSVAGDGGFQFGLQDLATAVQYGINLVVIVFNNSAYGNVLRDQQQFFQGHIIGSQLRNPDFVALGEAFGMASYRASTPEVLSGVLEKALSESAPALVEVPVPRGTEYSPWEFLMPLQKTI
jgi:acetolactate synthase-1/2/3 large subunit